MYHLNLAMRVPKWRPYAIEFKDNRYILKPNPGVFLKWVFPLPGSPERARPMTNRTQSSLTPTEKFDVVATSIILRGEKPTRGVEATLAPNEHQMHRVTAFMPDGQKVVVAQRQGKGGMDFNKLLGGKVFAVAADALSPVYEKAEDKKPTNVQKTEGGLPVFSSSGFYTLSTKEYPALQMFEGYTRLFDKGGKVMVITEQQLGNRQSLEMTSDLEWEILLAAFGEFLSDSCNLVVAADADVNKKRSRAIVAAQTQAEDDQENYDGVPFKELAVSKKDGNPFVLLRWQIAGEPARDESLLREFQVTDDRNRVSWTYLTVEECVARFVESAAGKAILAAIEQGKQVNVGFVQGHVMRCSPAFRRKAENVLAAEPGTPQYGDAVYIVGGLNGWVKGVVSVLHMMHPNFPSKDYDAHHYVAACRQAEVGLRKKNGGGWTTPVAVAYDLPAKLL
jgi:hypothetical protein